MWYAIITQDVENSLEGRKANRAAHLERLQTLVEQGRLLIAGPHPAVDADDPGEAGFTGSLIVADFDSLESAQAWAEDDPYTIGGVTEKIKVKPFKKVLP
ncbi:MAG: YciI family protein [Halioglobus sp.]